MRPTLPITALLVFASVASAAQTADSVAYPDYRPTIQITGTVHSWGHGFLREMMHLWEADFHKYQPGITFEDDLVSSAAAMAGLYSGRADLGVLAREITPPEIAAYEKVTRQPLFALDVLTGSLGNPDKIMTLGIFVNRANPLTQLSFDQLDAIFSAERRRAEPVLLRTWDQLGLTGPGWQGVLIRPYSGPAFEAPGYFFSQTVLNGSVLWNCNLTQFDDLTLPDGRTVDGYQRVVDAVGNDPDGIAISGAGYTNPQVKLLAISAAPDGPWIVPTAATVQARAYPLHRPVRFYINDGPRLPPSAATVEFLRYVLSRQGQQQVALEHEFLPVTPAVAAAERARLP